ncbi:hypothetical protein GUJ93_ZPchr0007g3632 [Zizania palustris]|uniref:Uncharacterized protein n=1 Tax=Zizania palustris TaxID=103762 RepID=A0A8J5VSC1_ZIZPA|nr:hypothetical protein GUJ93_ZPchr0007g3632 [Zizania palustris]
MEAANGECGGDVRRHQLRRESAGRPRKLPPPTPPCFDRGAPNVDAARHVAAVTLWSPRPRSARLAS